MDREDFINGIMVMWAAACLMAIFLAKPTPEPATEIKLIALCNGKLYGAIEEDQFPRNCAWVEPINFKEG